MRGMAKDVFFFHHTHRENGGEDDAASKYNQFEVSSPVSFKIVLVANGVSVSIFQVEMIKDLVMYFLR